MTSATDVVGLLPIMWSAGAGADVMKRIDAPLVGGVASAGIVVRLVCLSFLHVACAEPAAGGWLA